jgi:hypothetical protein
VENVAYTGAQPVERQTKRRVEHHGVIEAQKGEETWEKIKGACKAQTPSEKKIQMQR